MASREFRAVERNLSRLYYVELIETLQTEMFLGRVRTMPVVEAEWPHGVCQTPSCKVNGGLLVQAPIG